MLEGFQLQDISRDDTRFISALSSVSLSAHGLERAEAFALKLRETGEACAFCAVEVYAPHALLRSVVTPQQQRGQGYASALCQALQPMLKARGIIDLYAVTETADGLFDFLGYQKLERKALPEAIATSPLLKQICGAQARNFQLFL